MENSNMKPYIVHFQVLSNYGDGVDNDVGIVLAQNKKMAEQAIKDYVKSLNNDSWIDFNYRVGRIHSIKEFRGNVFTRLFEDNG